MEIKEGEWVRTKDGCIFKATDYWIYDYEVKTENIVFHSNNIIDLIEVRDYVNGYRVQDKYKSSDKKCLLDLDGEFTNSHCLEEIEIKSIVTKEQFSSIEYKI